MYYAFRFKAHDEIDIDYVFSLEGAIWAEKAARLYCRTNGNQFIEMVPTRNEQR